LSIAIASARLRCRVGLVDVLAAGARRAERVDAYVGRIDFDLDRLVDFRVDEHAGERRMAARVRIEWALAHQPVDPGLGAEIAECVVAGHLDAGALDARDLARRLFEDLGLVAATLAVTQVHAQQHRRPILRLGASAACLDVDKTGIRVHRIVEHPAELEILDRCGDASGVAFQDVERRVVLLAPGQLEQLGGVLERPIDPAKAVDNHLQLFFFLAELLRALGRFPDVRVFELPRHFLEARCLHIEVKDTSADRWRDAADRRAD
jgi:hypothetical protein